MSLHEALRQQIDGLRQALVGLANIPNALEEYVFGSMQRLALDAVNRADEKISESEALALAQRLIETIVRSAERDGRELATELVELVARMNAVGVVVNFERPVTLQNRCQLRQFSGSVEFRVVRRQVAGGGCPDGLPVGVHCDESADR